ncbi:CcoQ/FixQ family Cbb3-type cytochrome c oxidase assembly chaperone [Geomonas oryzae]|uniref:CcoQ/FixQ family Cbb3-type cytochrome c oxidase assembly chaperone n=1 Tax=Geomonas oryzae TaxID=2364273 RepID=UPI00100B6FCB|nr:CcoQ/FixQ family Cbb3-type cytochrome c oxidase assembly chaperone [Geomonas oryzae]
MDSASIYYLGVTLFLFIVFAAIVARTYRKAHQAKGEEPKFRMMDDDEPKKKDRPE